MQHHLSLNRSYKLGLIHHRFASLRHAFTNRTPSPQTFSTSASSRSQYFATCHPGLEEIVAQELSSSQIGAVDVHVGKAGVFFSNAPDDNSPCVMMKSNLWLRSAIRVLELLDEIDLDTRLPAGESLYAAFRQSRIQWTHLLPPDQTFSIESRIWGCSNLSNSNLVNIRGRDAICDSIRDSRGTRPAPPLSGSIADLPLFCTAFQDHLTIYRDTSGTSLHRRGYRSAMHKASLNESAASGCLSLAGFQQLLQEKSGLGITLTDPMCGSGTFLIEAALMAQNTAPGLLRRISSWPFLKWNDYSSQQERDVWRGVVEEARDLRIDSPKDSLFFGNDAHTGALELALKDAEAAGVKHLIKLHHGDCALWVLPRKTDLVVCNPPWGQRLSGNMNTMNYNNNRSGSDNTNGGRYANERDDAMSSMNNSNKYRNYDDNNNNNSGRYGNRQTSNAYNENMNNNDEELAMSWKHLSQFLKAQASGSKAFILSGSRDATQYLRLKASQRYPVSIGGVDTRLLEYEIR